MQQVKLPRSVQEIADVIGRQRALYLVGQLPTYVAGAEGKKSAHISFSVPKLARLRDDHQLVRILGRDDAEKLCQHFGGEILYPANCAEIYRVYRAESAVKLVREGRTVADVADVLGVHPRTVRNACTA
ncbi:helix-turn-helix domain-containing protein [Burkholderia gladioli]|uniref:helix-turn-helix domain-containing protein n=1 Tax=Burkholderia gladioli TaxID=28095 RepID=UPI001640A17A|nr:helix-turn-helix domain-containing protein [Burkholderia gladioli]